MNPFLATVEIIQFLNQINCGKSEYKDVIIILVIMLAQCDYREEGLKSSCTVRRIKIIKFKIISLF